MYVREFVTHSLSNGRVLVANLPRNATRVFRNKLPLRNATNACGQRRMGGVVDTTVFCTAAPQAQEKTCGASVSKKSSKFIHTRLRLREEQRQEAQLFLVSGRQQQAAWMCVSRQQRTDASGRCRRTAKMLPHVHTLVSTAGAEHHRVAPLPRNPLGGVGATKSSIGSSSGPPGVLHPTVSTRLNILSTTKWTQMRSCARTYSTTVQPPGEVQPGGMPPSDRGDKKDDDSQKEAIVEPPDRHELYKYSLHCMVPMIGFGFMDNLVMIQVGELIDQSIGVTLGFATMTSAALGQVCSDVSGVCFGGVVDAAFAKLGLPPYRLTSEQIGLHQVRMVRTGAMVIGVAMGCLLGMVTLLFMDLDKAERLKKQKQMNTIFTVVAAKGSQMMQCERVFLHILDTDKKHLWTMARKWADDTTSNSDLDLVLPKGKSRDKEVTKDQLYGALRSRNFTEQEMRDRLESIPEGGRITLAEADKLLHEVLSGEETRTPLREGSTKRLCVEEKRILNIANVCNDTRFVRSQTLKMMPAALKPESTLLGPVMSESGEVLGVVEMINKLSNDGSVISFTSEDERLMTMLCHHCALFMETLEVEQP